MAKQGNVVIVGKDGKIVIVDCKGRIALVGRGKVGSRVAKLVAARQAAGIALSAALADAGFQVCASQQSFVMDLSEQTYEGKKKKKDGDDS